jgi:hypothetical protein
MKKSWFSTERIRKEWSIGRLRIYFLMHNDDGHMGRFGGGWNRKLGIALADSELLVDIWVATLRFQVKGKK